MTTRKECAAACRNWHTESKQSKNRRVPVNQKSVKICKDLQRCTVNACFFPHGCEMMRVSFFRWSDEVAVHKALLGLLQQFSKFATGFHLGVPAFRRLKHLPRRTCALAPRQLQQVTVSNLMNQDLRNNYIVCVCVMAWPQCVFPKTWQIKDDFAKPRTLQTCCPRLLTVSLAASSTFAPG